MDVSKYATLVFDCDGVVLDSNKVKTTAFYNAALPYGLGAAEILVEYHKNHGGISRYRKFEYFLKEIVGTGVDQTSLDKLLVNYAREVRKSLITCQISPGLNKLRQSTQSRWLIVSGGDQNELRDIFAQRNLTANFNGGIFGSPDSKETILSRELKLNNIKPPVLFLGDSKYDYEAAKSISSDFIFISDWSEVKDWREYCRTNEIRYINNIYELIVR